MKNPWFLILKDGLRTRAFALVVFGEVFHPWLYLPTCTASYLPNVWL